MLIVTTVCSLVEAVFIVKAFAGSPELAIRGFNDLLFLGCEQTRPKFRIAEFNGVQFNNQCSLNYLKTKLLIVVACDVWVTCY